MPGPLAGIKVFEVSQIVAGPYAGQTLADFGADVVKCEPPGGEGLRVLGEFVPGESKAFHYIENSGYGDRGPGAERSGSDIIAQAYSGLMAADGKVDEYGAPEMITATAPGDYHAGLGAALGVVAALFHRERTGEGQHIASSLLAAGLNLASGSVSQLPVFDAMVTDPAMQRLYEARDEGASYREQLAAKGNMFEMLGKAFRLYYGGYSVKDGAVILGALTPANRDQFRRALGVEDDPTADPEFNALDPANNEIAEAMLERVRNVMLTKTMDEWIAAFDAVGAPASKVNHPEEMADDPQVNAMGYMVDLDHELTGPERMVGPIVQMSKTPTGNNMASPTLGRHTDEILQEHGWNDEEIAALRAAGGTD